MLFFKNKHDMTIKTIFFLKCWTYGLGIGLTIGAIENTLLADPLPVAKHKSSFNDMTEGDLMRFFFRCMKLIQSNYIDKIENGVLIEGAIQGMLNAIDPHSLYFNDYEYNRLQEQCKGSFGGIGLVMINNRSGMRVISCLDDTPAAKAGILPGDMIVAINHTIVSGADGFSGVSEMMRGEPGTEVILSIERKGAVLHFTIKRAIISVKSVKYHINGDVGVIRISNFDEQTADLLKNAIQEMQKVKKDKLRGYIIDLRSNPGGLVDSAVMCCQYFIDKGILLRSKGRQGTPEEIKYAVPGLAIVRNKPIVVLIDQGSASAAEMMAGALQDHKVAVILGVPSFGKGSTQAVTPLESKTGAIKLTVMRWYTPVAQRPIQGHGIIPDIRVDPIKSIEPMEADEFVLRESNFSRALISEPQKDKALQNKVPQKEGQKIDPVSKKPLPADASLVKNAKPADQDLKPDHGMEKNNDGTKSLKSTDPLLDSKEFDYQMLRALDVINALHSIQKLNIFNPTKKVSDPKNIQNFRHSIG